MLGKILEHTATLVIGIVACVIVAVIGGYYLLKPPVHRFTTATVETRDISETITESGKVDSDSHVSLSFKKAGTVSAVNVKVGDVVKRGQVLAAIDPGDLYASLQGAEADIMTAQANLASLQKGATSQTRAVYAQSVATAKSSLATAQQSAYLKVHDAVVNNIDTLFENGSGPNPQFIPPVESYQTGLNLTQSRVDLGNRLIHWNSVLSQDPTSDAALNEASSDITAAQSFVDMVSTEVSRLTTSNSGLTSAEIAAFASAASAAASDVSAANSGFTSAVQAYNTAVDQANVVTASSTPEAVAAAEAQVAKAEANEASVKSQLSDTTLTAPFDGVIGSVNPKAGESFDASVPAIDLLSRGSYKIDILIPENEIGAVAVGAPATVTFDAYGADLTATATVATVDLSETMTNGVGAYKATVYLNSSNPAIRTGMTGNVSIEGPSVSGVPAVPTSAVISQNGSSFVLALTDTGSFAMRQIQTGLSGEGWTEVRSGLSAGDVVAAFGNFAQ